MCGGLLRSTCYRNYRNLHKAIDLPIIMGIPHIHITSGRLSNLHFIWSFRYHFFSFVLCIYFYIFFCKVSFHPFARLSICICISIRLSINIYIYFLFVCILCISRTFKSKLNLGNLPYYRIYIFFVTLKVVSFNWVAKWRFSFFFSCFIFFFLIDLIDWSTPPTSTVLQNQLYIVFFANT